jgi:hypothetical protein
MKEGQVKKIIDLVDGAKILGRDEIEAQKLLENLLDILPEMRDALHSAYHARTLEPEAFYFITEKFYSGMLYVGAPALCQAAKDLFLAVDQKQQDAIDALYQHMLYEIQALEDAMAEMKTA